MVPYRWLDPTDWPMATPGDLLKLGGGIKNNLVIFYAWGIFHVTTMNISKQTYVIIGTDYTGSLTHFV